MKVFLAGAAGAIGRRLAPLLLEAGHSVTGTTRSGEKASELKARGVAAVVVDVFDATALRDAVARARPEVVIHQLTDLPKVYEPDRWSGVLARNSRLRIEGTANLVAAAKAAGAQPSAVTARGVRALEQAVLGAAGLDGIVLRYGRLFGPGTWHMAPSGRGALHVDAAAQAALLALTRGAAGVYNIAEPDGAVSIDKAQRELGFNPAFRLSN
jgi:nucleoside-diphosphate-sugar epimerase